MDLFNAPDHTPSPLALDVSEALRRLDVDRARGWAAYEREDAAHKATKERLTAVEAAVVMLARALAPMVGRALFVDGDPPDNYLDATAALADSLVSRLVGEADARDKQDHERYHGWTREEHRAAMVQDEAGHYYCPTCQSANAQAQGGQER